MLPQSILLVLLGMLIGLGIGRWIWRPAAECRWCGSLAICGGREEMFCLQCGSKWPPPPPRAPYTPEDGVC